MARDPSPQQVFEELERTLRTQGLARGYVLRGEELWYRSRARDLLIAAARAANVDVADHDARDPDFDVQGLHADLTGGSLFSERRLVVFRNGTGNEDLLKKTDGRDSPVTASLLRLLGDAGSGNVAVVDSNSLRADHAVAKAVKKSGGGVLGFRKLWDTPSSWNPDPRRVELVQWIGAQARAQGVRLSPDDAIALAAGTGNDLAALAAELRNAEQTGGASLRAAAERSGATKPWPVAEALCAGDLQAALPGIEGLFRGGFAEKTGRRSLDATALLVMVLGTARKRIHGGLAGEDKGGPVERTHADWLRMAAELADVERRTRTRARVDQNDLTALALRWRRRRAPGGRRP